MPNVISDKVNLIDMNFKQLSISDKRVAFVLMDIMLKKLHESGFMVTDFNPNKIYYQDGYYAFGDVSLISDYYVNSKEVAVFSNVLALANLAFCSYLPDYQLANGILNFDVICDSFDNFLNFIPEEDRNYYKGILVDSYNRGKIDGNTLYYSDYVIGLGKDNVGTANNRLAYIKATEVGKAFNNQTNESGFSNSFLLVTIVFSVVIGMIGVILYFSNYIG